MARELGDLPSVAFALGTAAQVDQITRAVQTALEMAEAAISMADNEGLAYFCLSRENREGLGSGAAWPCGGRSCSDS